MNPIPKVAAIHDISGFGRSSLTVVLPILSTMGIQVSALPTAVLSTHSQFPDYKFVDLTEHLMGFINHWKTLNIKFDAIYSGFLGSEKQVEIVKNFITTFKRKHQLVVVDPVLGDDGELYSPFKNIGLTEEMKILIRDANVITPNITEAALLLGKKYTSKISEKEIVLWAKELSAMGPQQS
jgi:pyridoxine kinase